DSGALSFTDVDSNDSVVVWKSYNGVVSWRGGEVSGGVVTALVAGFSVDQDSWDYSSSQNLDFLRAGETITFSYDVVATDDSGARSEERRVGKEWRTSSGTNDYKKKTMTGKGEGANEGSQT